MSLFQRIINDWATSFGLAPLHDVDLPDEPSDSAIAAALRPLRDEPTNPVSQPDLRVGTGIEASTRPAANALAGVRSVDGPTAPAPDPGAVGHLPTDWDGIRDDLARLRRALEEAMFWLDSVDPVDVRRT